MDDAIRDFNEAKDVILKLDEARFSLNKIMGPNGAMSEAQRQKFLGSNIADHDQLVELSKPLGNQYRSIQSIGDSYGNANVNTSNAINPVRSGSGIGILNNNPSKGYFNNAGIAGSQANL
jgi:hypothetical protein